MLDVIQVKFEQFPVLTFADIKNVVDNICPLSRGNLFMNDRRSSRFLGSYTLAIAEFSCIKYRKKWRNICHVNS